MNGIAKQIADQFTLLFFGLRDKDIFLLSDWFFSYQIDFSQNIKQYAAHYDEKEMPLHEMG